MVFSKVVLVEHTFYIVVIKHLRVFQVISWKLQYLNRLLFMKYPEIPHIGCEVLLYKYPLGPGIKLRGQS